MQKRKFTKSRLDSHAFKNLDIMTQERKEQMGNFLIQYGYKLKNDTSGRTIKSVMQDFKSILINLKKLQDNEE